MLIEAGTYLQNENVHLEQSFIIRTDKSEKEGDSSVTDAVPFMCYRDEYLQYDGI